MRKLTVDEVLKEGMYGPKETKPEERRLFLGTLRERILVALWKSQVKEKEIYPQVEQEMKKNPGCRLLLNGNIHYVQLSKYIKLAKKYNLNHTIVTNKDYDSDIGLVLAMNHAIDKKQIYVEKVEMQPQKSKRRRKKRKTSILQNLKKLFKRHQS